MDCVEEAMVQSEAFITARVRMYDGVGVDRRDTARYQVGMMWAAVGNTMPGTNVCMELCIYIV